jgi:uncharacterized membrane protein
MENVKGPSAAARNISRIAELEAKFDEKRTTTDRIADAIADWTGSLSFVILHLCWFACWILWNTENLFPIPKFDRFPFVLLSVIVSCEAVVLSTFVLIKQNRMSSRAEHREKLHLQINLLAEQEVTKLLWLQRLICERLGIQEAKADPDIADMSQETEVEHLARQLQNVKASEIE